MRCQRCGGPMVGYTALFPWDTDELACLNCGAREYVDALTQAEGVAERASQAVRYDAIGPQPRVKVRA